MELRACTCTCLGSPWKLDRDRNRKAFGMEEKDKELYERTRKATEESHKEAQVQFQSLVKAWPCFQNLGPPWQLLQYSEGPDFVPIACEAASCTCLVLTKKIFAGMLSVPVHIMGSVFLAFFCTTLLGFPFMVPKWYRRYRGVIFKYLAAILCVWESMQIFLMGDTDLLYVTYHTLALFMCTSVFYQVPYFIHLRWRFIGTVVQATALLADGNWRDVVILLSIIATSHLSGFLLVYILDERRRLESLKLTSRFMGENLSTVSTKSTYSEETTTTLFEHYYNLVCSQAIAKPTLVQVGSVTCSGGGVHHQVARRRALGGFAGGFAGVSGLKCKMMPPSTSLLSCSENSLSQQQDWMVLDSEFGDDEEDNATSSSISTAERFRYTNKHKQQWEALKGVSSIDSACSKTDRTESRRGTC